MCLQAALVILLMLASTVKTQDVPGKVDFWRNTVTLTCPEAGTWEVNDKAVSSEDGKFSTYQTEYKQSFKSKCKYGESGSETTYHFYVKGSVCENCFELEALYFMLVIIADVIGTAVVMMLIFKCTKKGNSDGSTHSSKPPLPSGSRGPTVPSRDYETLNPRTRAMDTYSAVVNRMG